MNGGMLPVLAAGEQELVSGYTAEPIRVLAVSGPAGAPSLLAGLVGSPSFAVTVAERPGQAIELARQIDPEVVVVDMAATGSAGFPLCRELRTFSVAYIVMLAGRDDDVDRRVGLSVGIDEYLSRPASAQDVVACILGMLSRPDVPAADDASSRWTLGDLTVDLVNRTVHVAGCAVALTRTEFDLLATLITQPHRVVSRAQLLQLVWGTSWVGEDHLIDVHMSNLRRKLGDTPRCATYLRTVRGQGYRIAGVPTQPTLPTTEAQPAQRRPSTEPATGAWTSDAPAPARPVSSG